MKVNVAVSGVLPILIGLLSLGCSSSSGGGSSSSSTAGVSSGSTASTTSGTSTIPSGTTSGSTGNGTGTVLTAFQVPPTAEDRFYEPHVRNVLYNYCVSCHADTFNPAFAAYPLNGFPSDTGTYNETLNRVDVNTPETSLLLAKASNEVAHGGGQILKPGDVGFAWLLNWIRQGANYDQGSVGPRTFSRNIQPFLDAQCFGCHSGGTGGYTVGSNVITNYNEMLSVTSAGDPQNSEILRKNDGREGHAGGAGWPNGSPERNAILQWIADGQLLQ